ncbi:MFS transporter [Candidatus Sneabacter namystus]|uniref:MFS transporter n=1 Tax=Candidatus Sneabacter namystus TaxID=2601646 RepID=A0A5C0UIL3_9RICK|nr:MFS transporter [Candidatus Sneabacter namystus]QEK39353.1 MFS transporter [Candidatus Sneabacter namystus]
MVTPPTTAGSTNNKLEKWQKEAVAMISVGTLLEYFDLMLYVHIAGLVEECFFPKDISGMWILSNLTMCSTFLFRPLGSVLFGWIGDHLGRKFTIFWTTIITSIACATTAFLPGYNKFGLLATYILTGCRVLQGMASLGELQGAKIYITESVSGFRRQCMLTSTLTFSAESGTTLAVLAALFATFLNKEGILVDGWRLIFLLGAFIGVTGTYARFNLRESTEFADANKKLQISEHHPSKAKVDKLWFFFYFIMKSGTSFGIVFFPYIYCKNLMKSYSAAEVISQNFLASIIGPIKILAFIYLVYKYVHPLKILMYRTWMFLVFMFVLPFFWWNIESKTAIFLVQTISLILAIGDVPASPLFFAPFPVLKRARCILLGDSCGWAFMSVMYTFIIPLCQRFIGDYVIFGFGVILSIITLVGLEYLKRSYVVSRELI